MSLLTDSSKKSDSSKIKKVKLFEPMDNVSDGDLKGNTMKVGGSKLKMDMNRALRWSDTSLNGSAVAGI